MHKRPYTTAEKAAIVAKGEARLGEQHFFGHGDTAPTQKSVVAFEDAVAEAENKFHDQYTELFAKALANLRTSRDLKRAE
jgi:hypothetical protein